MLENLKEQYDVEDIKKELDIYVNQSKEGYLEIRSAVKYIITDELEKLFDAKFVIHEGELQIKLDYANKDEDLCYFQRFASILHALKVQKGEWKAKKKQKLNSSEAKIL